MSVTAARLACLLPGDRAAFATTARLLSCLVTESILRALYFPIHGFEANGICVILNNDVSSEPPALQPYVSKDIFAVIPLHHAPVFKHDGTDSRAKEIALLDPLDMMPVVFEVDPSGTRPPDTESIDLSETILNVLSGPGWIIPKSTQLFTSRGPVSLWEKFGTSVGLQDALLKEISAEFDSSVKWQRYSYENPPPAPQFTSPSIQWEQSIVEGHPTHPMHKTRYFLPPLPDYSPGTYDLYHTCLRLVAVPKENLNITYNFEEYVRPILSAMSKKAGRPLVVREGYVGIPVHELQLTHIHDKFNEAEIYPAEFSLPLLAQQSVRSVLVPDAYRELSLKLGVGIKLTSAVRTISPASAYLGPRFSRNVVPVLSMDPSIVTVAKELASVVHTHPDGEIAKHCASIIREAHENTSEDRGERLIVCTALVESGHSGEDGHLPAVVRVFGLHTEEKRVEWFTKFARMLLKAFLPSVLDNGVAFECHPQNCLARFDIVTKELRGFIIRDFGGLRVHPETLKATTGVDLEFLAGHSIIANDVDDVYTRMYHTVFHNHLQQLIRVLGLHYNGRGWTIVRELLEELIPKSHGLYAAWLSPERRTLPGKCFLRMRMSGMYRFHLHSPFSNLIHYHGV